MSINGRIKMAKLNMERKIQTEKLLSELFRKEYSVVPINN